MLVQELISDEIPFLTIKDNCQQVSTWMDEFKMTHLPIIDEGKYLGLISESAILDIDNWDDTIGDHTRSIEPFGVHAGDHVFEAVKILGSQKLSCIGVRDDKDTFLGSISLTKIVEVIGELSLISDTGGIIMVEINEVDYSMSQIAQIVESNGAKLLGSYITSAPQTDRIRVTVKLNKQDVSDVIQTFERYDYQIFGSFHISESSDNLEDRFNNLINFLNI